MKYILISNGDFDSRTVRNMGLDEYTKICVDGGIRHFWSLALEPDIIIGDLDSADSEMLEEYRNRGVDIVKYPPEKDKTDTEIAIEYAVEKGASEITMLGSTGSRMDHTLGSINLLYRLKENGVDAKIVDLYNEVRIVSGTSEIEYDENYRYVSLLPYGGDAKNVTLKGFKYELAGRDFSFSDTIGISNEMKDRTAIIEIGEGQMVLVRSR